jgi:hypothetical protein
VTYQTEANIREQAQGEIDRLREQVEALGRALTAEEGESHRLANLNKKLREALTLILALDDDAHPGLFTWQDARMKAGIRARAALKETE